jgi:hypothetical protein
MIELWEQLAKQAPWAVVILIILAWFFKFTRELIRKLAEIGEACHQHTDELNKKTASSIDRAATIIVENSKVIGANTEVIREVERRINGKSKNATV